MKTKTIVIDKDVKDTDRKVIGKNLDGGKKFVIKKMSAFDAEKLASDIQWGAANNPSKNELTEKMMLAGLVALKVMGYSFIDSLPRDLGKDIGDRLLSCVKVPSPTGETLLTEADIEDWQTVRLLKKEALEFQFDFLVDSAHLDTHQ